MITRTLRWYKIPGNYNQRGTQHLQIQVNKVWTDIPIYDSETKEYNDHPFDNTRLPRSP